MRGGCVLCRNYARLQTAGFQLQLAPFALFLQFHKVVASCNLQFNFIAPYTNERCLLFFQLSLQVNVQDFTRIDRIMVDDVVSTSGLNAILYQVETWRSYVCC